MKYLKLYESYESKPEIFSHTIYRLPMYFSLKQDIGYIQIYKNQGVY